MYLYVFEDGSYAKSEEEPTQVDLAMIGDGLLHVFETEGEVEILDEKGNASAVEVAALGTGDDPEDTYHYADW